jgi:23S rRNA (adenine1618-N6)-methyltransferase
MSKSKIHPRNKHQGRYELAELVKVCPDLKEYLTKNLSGEETVDFAEPNAVRLLNKALLLSEYDMEFYEIPEENLTPPIPGRADYIHYAADLLASLSFGKVPKGANVKVLDIGTGANCIYPILGQREYGWSFVATDIDKKALEIAAEILSKNKGLAENITLRHQKSSRDVFHNVLEKGEKFQLSVCNPPFHASAEDAMKSSGRKLKNLHGDKKEEKQKLNFSGVSNELWCDGGEKKFIQNMIYESAKFKTQVIWFTTLVSKETHLKSYYAILDKCRALEVRTIPMGQGNKTSRILAWTYTPKQRFKKKVVKKED